MPVQRIEDAINSVLEGDTQRNALDFVAYLRAQEIPLEDAENYWEVKYQNECVCCIWVNGSDEVPGPWTIWSAEVPGSWDTGRSMDFPTDDHFKEIAWANVNVCGNCGGCANPGGTRKTVLGKSFDNLCNAAMAFTNPGAEALHCAKRMVDTRINDILKAVESI